MSVQVCVFVFDLLYAGGASLLRLPLRERRQRLLQVGHRVICYLG